MKKLFAIMLTVALSVCACSMLTACGGKIEDTIYIGVFEPASGSNGAGGKQETLGVKYANSVKNSVKVGDKTYKVELVVVDNQSKEDKAVSAAGELVNKNCVVALGSYGSSVSIAASDTFKKAGMPAVGITCTNPLVTQGNSHYFRVCFLDDFQGSVLAKYAKDEGNTKAYVLAELGNAYDVGLATYFKKAFGESECVYENFPSDTPDFTAYITKAKDQGCSVIFAPTSINYAELIIKKAKDLGFKGLILAGDTWDSNKVVAAANDAKDFDVKVTTFYQEGANAEFDKGFADWINGDNQRLADNGGNDMIAAVSVMGYDAYMTAIHAIEKSTFNPTVKDARKAIMDSLAAMNSVENAYAGVTGNIYFDATGDAKRESAFIKEADGGVWKFVKEQKAD